MRFLVVLDHAQIRVGRFKRFAVIVFMTGTKDEGVIGGTTPKTRLEVYKALPDGDMFQLILHDAEHLAFTESRIERGRYKERQKTKSESPPRDQGNHDRILGYLLKGRQNGKSVEQRWQISSRCT